MELTCNKLIYITITKSWKVPAKYSEWHSLGLGGTLCLSLDFAVAQFVRVSHSVIGNFSYLLLFLSHNIQRWKASWSFTGVLIQCFGVCILPSQEEGPGFHFCKGARATLVLDKRRQMLWQHVPPSNLGPCADHCTWKIVLWCWDIWFGPFPYEKLEQISKKSICLNISYNPFSQSMRLVLSPKHGLWGFIHATLNSHEKYTIFPKVFGHLVINLIIFCSQSLQTSKINVTQVGTRTQRSVVLSWQSSCVQAIHCH